MVKGFKGFNEDLTCRGFQYEIGKTYKHNGEVELCRSGFHFCRKLKDVHQFYNLKLCRKKSRMKRLINSLPKKNTMH